MKALFLLFFTVLSLDAFGVCSSPISRTNNSSNSVLTSTKYNTDINTVYSRVNELPGDCITDATVSTAKIANEAVTEAKLAAEVVGKFLPPGVILPYGGTSAPTGFLLCNGAAVSRTTYSSLYAVVGNAFGSGNGTTTFNVPDLRGRFLRGVDGGVGRDPDRASRTAMSSGGNAGDNVGSVQDDQLESHRHSLGDSNNDTSNNAGAFSMTGAGVTALFSGYTGGNETRPVNANVQYIIKI
jgi:microcystin-dependent protein